MSKLKTDQKLDEEDSSSKSFLEGLHDSFIRRFSRTPLAHEPIVYEFTNDRAMLHQYYRIREIMYRKTANAHKMGEEDVYDKLAHVLDCPPRQVVHWRVPADYP